MDDKEIFKKEDIALHSDSTDCWVIVNGQVWDVSNYLSSHPGGADGNFQIAYYKIRIANESLKSYSVMPEKTRLSRITKYTTPTSLNEPCHQHV